MVYGLNWVGMYVFRISNDGKHGLVSETINQGIGEATWAQDLISNPVNHSDIGVKFMDWRFPTEYIHNLRQEVILKIYGIGHFWL